MWARLQNVSTHFGNCSADVQQQTTAGHPTFQFGEIFGDYFVWTAWSSVTSPGSVQGAVCGHKLGFLLLQVASNKYYIIYSTGGGFEGRSAGSGESTGPRGGSGHQYQVNHVQVMTRY